MKQYGARYIPVGQFVSYCADLKVKTTKDELEHYERECLMLPTARTLEPIDHLRARLGWASGPASTSTPPPAPTEWLQLQDDPWRWPTMAEPGIDDPFDRELGRNQYLEQPQCKSRKPLGAYDVTFESGDRSVSMSREESYYSYWQVHQLVLLQEDPDLWANLGLFNAIPDDAQIKQVHLGLKKVFRPPETFRTLRGWAASYDAVSLWATRRSRKRRILFARIPDSGGYKHLPDQEMTQLERELQEHTKAITQAHSLCADDLLAFLQYLVNLRDDYRSAERASLTREVAWDINTCADFIYYLDGSEWETVGDRLAKIGGYWLLNSFLRTAPAFASRKDAERNLSYITGDYVKQFGETAQPSEPKDIATFCFDRGLFEVLDALNEYSYTEEEEIDAWYGFYFRRMRLLGLALEQFVKALAPATQLNGKDTLTPLIERMAADDPGYGNAVVQLWKTKRKMVNFTSMKTTAVATPQKNALRRLQELLSDQDLVAEPQVRNLLVACLARNAAIHTAPTDWDDVRERSDVGQMVGALATAFIQVWHTAKSRAWV